MATHLIQNTAKLISQIREIYGGGFIPLHRPIFDGNEKNYLVECVDSNFVSSVGERVKIFEKQCAHYTGIEYGVSAVNGTAALHMSLLVSGVSEGDEVITQALTFVATCNAISYCGAKPVFIDVDKDTLGLSPEALLSWLSKNTELRDGCAYNSTTGARVAACVPMHTFGNPLRVDEVVKICKDYGIKVVEDAAESLGSFLDGKHTGSFGQMAAISFNGNKIITTGGGGMILTNDGTLAKRALHLTTTAKLPHDYEFDHDEIGFNYRMPNINAALGCAQMEKLAPILESKRQVFEAYSSFFDNFGIHYVTGIKRAQPNYWLNAIITSSRNERDHLLQILNDNEIMARPLWRMMNKLNMFKSCQTDHLKNAHWLEDRVVNIPSSVPDGAIH